MASNSDTSYIIFNYGELEWPNRIVNVSVTVGVNLGDNQTYFQIEPSIGHFNLTDLQHGSNVGVRSRLINQFLKFNFHLFFYNFISIRWTYRVDTHKNEIDAKLESEKTKDSSLFYGLLILIILIGINSLVSTALWINKYRNRFIPPPSIAFNKQLNESQMVLNQSV